MGSFVDINLRILGLRGKFDKCINIYLIEDFLLLGIRRKFFRMVFYIFGNVIKLN